MEGIRISDTTMKQLAATGEALSFKGKLEIAKLLDKLGVCAIEVEGLSGSRSDVLRVKSLATAVKGSVLAVPVSLDPASVDATWEALSEAAHPRLQVSAPMSAVQMEYLSHLKPAAMLPLIGELVSACKKHTDDVEFLAEDATRADAAFLAQAIDQAIAAGATTVTVCDSTGAMLPDEFAAFIEDLRSSVPALDGVALGVSVSDGLSMADACTLAALRAGAVEAKACATGQGASLANIAQVISSREELFGGPCHLHTVELRRIVGQIEWLCSTKRTKTSPFDDGVQDSAPDVALSFGDGVADVLKAAARLGYELNDEDGQAVLEAVQDVLKHKELVDARELDAIIASVALQFPATYEVESYVINSGSGISAMAHLRIAHAGEVLEAVALGDGPIDAAFLAMEKITNHHYELDDFQIRAVTEGHEAMGETVVRLLSDGRLYSGRGISMDIVGSSIQAYVNALNKIAYEEDQA